VVATVSGPDHAVLFESPDVTTLYSQYRQTKLNINLYSQNLKRLKEMFDNHNVTASEVNRAENDLAIARTTLTETQAKLRTAGFNPAELDRAGVSTVWIISDVAESQLSEVQSGEEVPIVFNAFPETEFIGHVASIGDVVDPITRTVKVRSVLVNRKNKMLPGMFAVVDFGDPTDSVVKLNSSAIVTVDGKDYCFVEKEKGVYERREVIIKVSGEDGVVVMKGLKNGDKAVTEGAILLKGISFGY
jgi:multidrug efflux pump subunit AcrA (membrane-fusion protein)